MKLFAWADSRIALMKWYDIGLLKFCVAAFVLMVAKLWPPLLLPDWKVFGVIFLITYAPLFVKTFFARDGNA